MNLGLSVYIISEYWPFIVVGVSLLVVGLIIPKFKLYWLITGLNGLPKEALKRIDLRYVEKHFGRFMVLLGVGIVLNPFLCVYFGYEQIVFKTFLIFFVSIIISMYLFGAMNRNKIYKSGTPQKL